MAVDMKVVEEKISKGEALSADELKEVMSAPPEGTSNILNPEDDIKDEDFNDDDTAPEDKGAKEEKPAAEEKPKDEKPAAEQPKEEKPKAEEDPQSLQGILKELDKPEGKEDLSNLTQREKGIFWEMRRERRRAQAAESERDALRFEKVKRQKDDETKKTKDEEEADPFKDRGDDEPLTVKDMKTLMDLNKKKTPKDTGSAGVLDPNSPLIASVLKAHDEVARKDLGEDYDETVECSAEIISNNPVYLEKIANALLKGENVAKLTYTLIKGDPEYTKTLPIAQARLKAAGKTTTADKPAEDKTAKADEEKKKKDALEAQKKLEENNNKKKTSVHADGSEAPTNKDMGEYTIDRLLAMSDRDFAKVPKKVREAFLKQHGA